MMVRKYRGSRLGKRLVNVFKWLVKGRPQSRIFKWGLSLKQRAKWLSFPRKSSEYFRVGSGPVVPKGHLAVYVGDKEDERSRVLVPVIYFNHPLFVNLLREAEKVYGFNHEGGIQIPCEKSQFENVRMRISAAARGGRSCFGRRWSGVKL